MPQDALSTDASATDVNRLTRVNSWIFDLDNTLYPATCSLFPQIDQRMKEYISRLLNLSPEDAFRLQKQYYREFGTSLRGLMLRHQVEPDAFLAYVHDIDHSVLSPEPLLADLLARLPGRRMIFTNGSRRHAENVLKALGLEGLFEGIFDIQEAGYIPKPQPETYQRMLEYFSVDPQQAIFFEDSCWNLQPAAAIGMLTVLVQNGPDHAPMMSDSEAGTAHCDYVTETLTDWLQQYLDGVL